MPNLTTVTLTTGVPTAGTGTVSTIDNMLGVAGTPSAQVQTVQGVTSMTPLKVDGSGVTQPVSIATAPVLVAGSALIGKVGVDQTTDGTTNKVAADLRVAGTIVDHTVGTGGSATQRVSIDTAQLAALSTTAQAMSAGYQLVAIPTDQVVPNKVQAQTNGATDSRVNAANSTNATSLKASAGSVYEIDVFNVAAYNVFLKLYNKASAPTVGTDTPVMTIPVPAGGGYSKEYSFGKSFATGVAYAITKLQADSDTTVVLAGDLTGAISWI